MSIIGLNRELYLEQVSNTAEYFKSLYKAVDETGEIKIENFQELERNLDIASLIAFILIDKRTGPRILSYLEKRGQGFSFSEAEATMVLHAFSDYQNRKSIPTKYELQKISEACTFLQQYLTLWTSEDKKDPNLSIFIKDEKKYSRSLPPDLKRSLEGL